MKMKGASVSPWSTPSVILKKSVSPSGERTTERVLWYSIIMTFTVSFGVPYADSISLIFPRWTESNALEKSMNRRVAGRFLDFMPSKIHRIVSICPDVDLLERKPFWFFLSIGSVSGLILFSSIRL